ncbi:MAG: hypothetical protein HYX46_02300 [Betaproteobacteria bacterium]|jgi:hypothetical protein|nr:hypothetical protein [Betaproteobacteria bacterium]
MSTAFPRTTTTKLAQLRARLAGAFSGDTATPGTVSRIPSAGHCAAVAAVVRAEFGGQFVSTIVDAQSHWFNRIHVGGQSFDVDLTGDQFGLGEIRIARAGNLFPSSRVRGVEELNDETLRRARLLASRSRIPTAGHKLSVELMSRSELAVA